METNIKVAGYIRVSTSIQAEEGESLSTQEQQIKEYCKSKGWELYKVYADEGATGTKIEYRIQFQNLLKDAKEKKFNVIVFTKLSRFARNARDYQNLSHELSQYGIQLISIKENIDPTTPIGRMIAGMLALFAEWEHETIREQMYENKMIKWKEKRAFIGKPPFGYQWSKEKKQLEVVLEEKNIYLEVVNMYCEQRMAMRDIAVALNSRGLKCKRAVWSSGTISYMLKNPTYYGVYEVNKYKYEDGKRGAGTKRTKNRKNESEVISFPVPAFITKPEWDKIQKATELNKMIPKRFGETTMSFFLRNSLICGRCGSRMNAHMGNKRKDGTFPRYYKCYYSGIPNKALESGRLRCDLPNIKAEEIEAPIYADLMVMFALNPKQAFKDIFDPAKHSEKINEVISSISRLENELSNVEKRKKKLLRLEDDEQTDDDIKKELREARGNIIELNGQILNAREKLKDLQKTQTNEKEALDFFNKNRKQLAALTDDITNLSYIDRKRLIEAMLVEPARVDYQIGNQNDPEDGTGPVIDFHLRYNPEILKRFIDEGKIGVLNKNGRDDNSSSDP